MIDRLTWLPIPRELEPLLVPSDGREVRNEVRCDWIDFTSARSWEPAEASVGRSDPAR